MAKGDKDEKGKKDAVTKIMDEKSPADFTDKDIVDVKEDMVTTFLDNMKDDVKADKVLDTKEKQDKFVKDVKKLKKDEVKKKGATPPPPPGGGQIKTKTGTVMSLVTKPEAIVTQNTTVQLKVTGVNSGVTQVISVILTP